MNPKVSIIIPVYNAEKYIKDCVMSCLAQAYDNKEIIIVDNESTDNSLKIILELKELYPELIIGSAKNIYKYSWQEPVEEAWKLMSGEYFTIIGADDYIHNYYISNCVDEFSRLDSSVDMIQSHVYCFKNNFRGEFVSVTNVIAYNYKDINDLKRQMLNHCAVASPTVFYKSRILNSYKIEFDSEKYLGACDYHMYCSLINQGAYIHPANRFLGYFYRVHEAQSTWGMVSEETRKLNIDFNIKLKFSKLWKNG